MNKLSFLRGYLAKTAGDSVVDEINLPSNENEAELLLASEVFDDKAKKKKIRTELKRMEATLAVIRAEKKKKELALYE